MAATTPFRSRPARAVPAALLLLLLAVVAATAASAAGTSWLRRVVDASLRAGDGAATAARRQAQSWARRTGQKMPCLLAYRGCKALCEAREVRAGRAVCTRRDVRCPRLELCKRRCKVQAKKACV